MHHIFSLHSAAGCEDQEALFTELGEDLLVFYRFIKSPARYAASTPVRNKGRYFLVAPRAEEVNTDLNTLARETLVFSMTEIQKRT